MALLFVFGALVQLNDPDPLGWTLLYAAAATSSALATLAHRRAFALAAVTCLVASGWALLLALGIEELAPLSSLFSAFEMKSAAIEETRELLGLVIIGLWTAAILAVSRRPRP